MFHKVAKVKREKEFNKTTETELRRIVEKADKILNGYFSCYTILFLGRGT